MFMIRPLMPVFLAVIVLFVSGCSGDSGKEASPQAPVTKIFPKITNHKLSLNIISKRGEYYIAEGAPLMRFQFRNDGLNRIELPEWKTRERENIRIFYAPCPAVGGSAQIPDSAWMESPRNIVSSDCPRYPLELEPKNSIIMDLPLQFIGKLEKPGRYAVRAEMDLTSISVRSEPVEIKVR